MPNFTLKQIPDEIFLKLRRQAEVHHRSINSEIIACLEKALNPQEIQPDQILRQARELRAQVPGTLTAEEIQRAIGVDRS
jgi:plasmid stability protein